MLLSQRSFNLIPPRLYGFWLRYEELHGLKDRNTLSMKSCRVVLAVLIVSCSCARPQTMQLGLGSERSMAVIRRLPDRNCCRYDICMFKNNNAKLIKL